jgi:hypothetical protein
LKRFVERFRRGLDRLHGLEALHPVHDRAGEQRERQTDQ